MQKWNLFLRVVQVMVFLVPFVLGLGVGLFVLIQMLFMKTL